MKTTWVIRKEDTIGKDRTPFAFWWYGPDHGYGRTWGSAQDAHTFRTRKEAEQAFRNEYGVRVAWKPQRLVDAIAENEARTTAYEIEKAAVI